MRSPSLHPPLLLASLLVSACGGEVTSAPIDGSVPADDLIFAGTPRWVVQKPSGLSASAVGLLINLDDPQSVAVGAHYRAARQLPDGNVVSLHLGKDLGVRVDAATFAGWKKQIDAALPDAAQVLAVSWIKPSIVDCMSITSALAFGFDRKWCNTTGKACGPTDESPWFASDSMAPFTDLGIRPAMVLAGATAEEAIALIDRGVAADDTFPAGTGWMITTTDAARSSRTPEFRNTAEAWTHPDELDVRYLDNSAGKAKNYLTGEKDVLFYFTGLVEVPDIATNSYRPGAIADHLTSFGGQIPESGQMSILKWIQAGATASFGTVAEPCNYTMKFPNPELVLPAYYAGATLIEAYWKSVEWPGEGLFIGEPLARPWGTRTSFKDGVFEIVTTELKPDSTYAVLGADRPEPEADWQPVVDGISVPYPKRQVIRVMPPHRPCYKMVVR